MELHIFIGRGRNTRNLKAGCRRIKPERLRINFGILRSVRPSRASAPMRELRTREMVVFFRFAKASRSVLGRFL